MHNDPRQLLYAAGQLDPDGAMTLTRQALAGADDGELFLQYRASEALVFDDGALKAADYAQSAGFGLRAVAGEKTGFAHASELSAAAIARAIPALSIVTDGHGGAMAAPPHRTNRRLYDDANPIDGFSFVDKLHLCQAVDTAARAADPRVRQVSVSLTGSWSVIEILRADGTRAFDVRPLVRLNVSLVMAEGDRRESGSFGIGGRRGFADLMERATWQRAIDAALRQASNNLESQPAPAGEMAVLLGPGWPGILLHEAVGHGLEGDFNRKGTSVFSGRMGTQVAAKGVTVIDDGSLLSPLGGARRGSLNIDDEGTPCQANILIEDGILTSYMHDRQSARLMGVAPTGNGRRESYAHAPMPRMTNTFMAAGADDPNELLSRLSDGIYATSFGGGQVDIVSGNFTFSCTEAWRVKNGRKLHPIRGATLIGNGPRALQQIIGIGNDLALDEGIGVCGKAGQSVPAGVGQPSLLIEGLTVGGTAE